MSPRNLGEIPHDDEATADRDTDRTTSTTVESTQNNQVY
jgi:hypothetical protein